MLPEPAVVPPLDSIGDQRQALGLLLRLLYQHWTRAIDEALTAAGYDDIRGPHANVFTFLPPEGMRVSELTKLAHVRKQTMAQAVEELEALGYVERRPDPTDRRSRLVFLTERGKQIRPLAMTAGQQVLTRWSELSSPEEIEDLARALRRLLDRVNAAETASDEADTDGEET
jgi:DNA-binding MarR family transcriptional regulator